MFRIVWKVSRSVNNVRTICLFNVHILVFSAGKHTSTHTHIHKYTHKYTYIYIYICFYLWTISALSVAFYVTTFACSSAKRRSNSLKVVAFSVCSMRWSAAWVSDTHIPRVDSKSSWSNCLSHNCYGSQAGTIKSGKHTCHT